MSRLPIRLRLALSFTAAAAVLLTAVGAFGYQRLAAGSLRDFAGDGLRVLARSRARLCAALQQGLYSLRV